MNVKGIAVGVLLAAIALAALPAGAANCENDTRRDIKDPSGQTGVRTYLHNKTAGTTVVGRIYRNGDQKDQAVLAPGESMVQVATTTSQKSATANIMIVFAPNDNSNLDDSGKDTRTQAHCSFSLDFLYNKSMSRVSKVSCPDMGIICTGCTINCKRSWNADKSLWHMHFNLIEPSR